MAPALTVHKTQEIYSPVTCIYLTVVQSFKKKKKKEKEKLSTSDSKFTELSCCSADSQRDGVVCDLVSGVGMFLGKRIYTHTAHLGDQRVTGRLLRKTTKGEDFFLFVCFRHLAKIQRSGSLHEVRLWMLPDFQSRINHHNHRQLENNQDM